MENPIIYFLPHRSLQNLIDTLIERGYLCIGPKIVNASIVYDRITQASELPWGIMDEQKPGTYRLAKSDPNKAFSWTNGPQGLKPHLFKAYEDLWVAYNKDSGLSFKCIKTKVKPIAYLGAKACDLAALEIQDKIFLKDKYIDIHYQARRENLFVVAINCTHCSGNCFCVSTGDGPRVTKLFDLAMTELNDDGLVVNAGTNKGKEILQSLQLDLATEEQKKAADAALISMANSQKKELPSRNLRDILFANLDHPRWEDVATRCLSCTNCTLVCPTCFCHCSIEEPELDGSSSLHKRGWDSCFTQDHSYIHGNLIRNDIRKRYRMWLTHKLGSWHDQFGRSGCVGCGRCITWCPVGIDITEEATAICKPRNDTD